MLKVTSSFLNCKNIKANCAYAQHIVSMSNIVYLNEIWLKPNEKPVIEERLS